MTRYDALQIIGDMGDPESDFYYVNEKTGVMYRWEVYFANGFAELHIDMYDPQTEEFESFEWIMSAKETV